MHTLALLLALAAGPALAGTPRASSELRDNEDNRYPAAQAFDGLLQTAWAEGELGDGKGAWLELPLDAVTQVQSVSIWPGNLAGNQRTIREYGRPKTIRVTLSGAGEDVVVEKQLTDPSELGALRVDIDVQGAARKIRIDIDDVFPGGIFSDLFIAEVAVNFVGGERPASVAKLQDYLQTDAGKKALATNKDEIVALYDKIKGSEFGARDALLAIIDRAGDGAPFLRKQVLTQVPAGYRVQALPPDEVAVEALLKLKDSNAIPAIQRAALRTVGPVAAKFQQYVTVFNAHQDLVGGANRSVRPWGEPGFAKGALQGLGEPLQLEIDQFGGVYVADLGNSRVQRFGQNGTVEKVWGTGEPLITNVWFQGTRPHYASGNTPSDQQGGFTNPVDVAVIPGKLFDTVAVLDALGRVTLIGDGDVITSTWKVPSTEPIVGGVGGEGYVLWVKNKLVVVWGNEGFVYSLEGEQLGQFAIEDGVPTGAVALGGKMGLIFGDELVLYSLDGFRHGDVMRGALGRGFEAWDVTLDEAGKLWALTDEGLLAKFKKPGKIEYQVRLDENLEVPRLDVIDNFAFVTSEDTILKFDALELHAEQTAAAAEQAAKAKAAEEAAE